MVIYFLIYLRMHFRIGKSVQGGTLCLIRVVLGFQIVYCISAGAFEVLDSQDYLESKEEMELITFYNR